MNKREQVTSTFTPMGDSITGDVTNKSASDIRPGMERPRYKPTGSGGMVPRVPGRAADRAAVSHAVLTSARPDEPVQVTDGGGGMRFSCPNGWPGASAMTSVLPAYARRPIEINSGSGQALYDQENGYLQRQLAKVHGTHPGNADYYASYVKQVDDRPFGADWGADQ